MANSEVSLTFTEKALADGQSGGCAGTTAENPPCGRLTIQGKLTLVPDDKKALAEKFLFSRHPEMEDWGKEHHFKPFWMDPDSITAFFLINFYGGAVDFPVKDYLAAPWYRQGGKGYICQVCGHIYDPQRDGEGKSFEDLPDDWTCPICGASKKSYSKVGEVNGEAIWAHGGDHHEKEDQLVV